MTIRRGMVSALWAVVAAALGAACASTSSVPTPPSSNGEAAPRYRQAGDFAAANDFPRALAALAASFEAGYGTPSDVLSQVEFAPLRLDPEARQDLRALLREHARESAVRMIAQEEPGVRLDLVVEVTDDTDGTPLEHVLIELVQTDQSGLYQRFTAAGEWNPRLFAFGRTDARGSVLVRTIRPGHYHPAYEADDHPAHVHFSIDAPGYRPFGGEILFDDDPRLSEEERRSARRSGFPIAVTRADPDGVQHAAVRITLQRAPVLRVAP